MKKLALRKRKDKQQVPSRITNETVAEHRERILAGGRRFKYPMQYARHKLVFNTIIVTVAALLLLIVIGWWQLYIMQNTGSLMYRITRVLPLPVASVDGEKIRFSDYLMYYNSSVYYLQRSEQVNLQSEDGKRQVDYIKRKSMDNVVANAYAAKLAREMNISIDDKKVDAAIEEQRNTTNGKISQETYDASIASIYGWSPSEYRHATRSNLLRQEIAFAVDTAAKKKAESAATLVKQQDADFNKIAASLGGSGSAKITAGVSGLVPRTNQDGGLSIAAVRLDKGGVAGPIKATTGDGYYFVKLLEKSDTQVNYAFLRIPLTEFTKRLSDLKTQHKIHEYITIPSVDNQTGSQ